MKVLITGATGFLGGRILEDFAEREDFATIIASGRKLSSSQVQNPKVTYLLGDLGNKEFVQSLFASPVDVVINCASLSAPWGSKEAFYQANCVTQKNLIAASIKNKVSRFVYISSPSIYFDFKDNINITEEKVPPPVMVNHYAITKSRAEKQLRNSGLNFMILRPRALIGRGDTVIMPRLIRSHKEKKLMIMGNGQNIVDMTPVSNMVQAVRLASIAPADTGNEDFNISNGEPVNLWNSINKVLDLIELPPVSKTMSYKKLLMVASFMEWKARFLKLKKEPVLTKYAVGILAKSFTFDITKAKTKLGYNPIQTTEEAIEEFANWYKNKQHD